MRLAVASVSLFAPFLRTLPSPPALFCKLRRRPQIVSTRSLPQSLVLRFLPCIPHSLPPSEESFSLSLQSAIRENRIPSGLTDPPRPVSISLSRVSSSPPVPPRRVSSIDNLSLAGRWTFLRPFDAEILDFRTFLGWFSSLRIPF